MGRERSMDDKLAPYDFVADFVWAARVSLQQPSVALVSIVVWCFLEFFFAVALHNKNPIAVLLAIGLSLWALGWLGAERTFFRDRREGKKVALRDLLASVPLFIGRFLRLGVLVGILVSPMMAVAIVISAWLATAGRAAVAKTTIHVSVITMLVAVDLALTFVTPVLVFTTQSAREALRLGIGIIRQTWPRSGLYVLCPPLALNLLNAMYPTHHLVVILLRTAGFAVLALVAKGATAAFYLRERTVSADVIVGVG
jgi:hypothetical protein